MSLHHSLNEQEIQRRESLEKIKELGIDPFPAATFSVSNSSSEIKQDFQEEEIDGERHGLNFKDVSLAGRLMSIRGKGKALFGEIQDSHGRIQIYIRRDDICPGEDKTLYDTLVTKLLDLGDYIGVKGFVFKTKMGETTIHVNELTFLSKSLRVLPMVKTDAEGNTHDAFLDPELRYRQRYVDLTVNPQFKEIFIKRTKLIKTIRTYLDDLGLMEVETPVLQAIHGGAAARPFATHHNTLDMPMYLRIANELYLKRLIVAGFDGVYELGKMFRNEGMDRTHNPEFSMLEYYVAYKDYLWLMDRTEEMFEKIAMAIYGSTMVESSGHNLEFKGPYRRLSMHDSIKEYTGVDVSSMDESELRTQCHEWHIHVDKSMGVGKLIDEIFSAKVEKNLIQPTFITDHPIDMSPLTKKHRSKPGLVERFELFVLGKEVGNAYSELNDPLEQRSRFEDQAKLADRGDDEAMAMDEDFLRALEYGMPPTAGIGFGIDRLVMLFTGQSSIQEVLFFPQMRAEKVN
jgi:lysyl-tRNA synthetase, class II